MSNLQQFEQQANVSSSRENSGLAGKFFAWLGTELRTRHEAALRRRRHSVRLRSANPTPV